MSAPEPTGLRRAIRQLALGATIAAGVWAASLVVLGGFALNIFGVVVRSHSPVRPLIWGSVALAAFVWANGVKPTADSWLRFASRIDTRLIAAGLAGWVAAMGLFYGAKAGYGADSYGYVSQADLWIDGDLKVSQPWVAEVPWPSARWTFTPLGYRPLEGEGQWDLVPTYAPGLPILMAGAKLAAGQCAMFWIVPIGGGILVWATYGLGRRLGSPLAGLIAAWLVATSPAFLYMLMLPMTDVPVAAAWTLAFLLVLAPGVRAAGAAGLIAALAVLIRPNLVPLAGLLGLWLVVRIWWDGAGERHRRVLRAGAFALGLAPGVLVTALVNNHLYSSPFVSGYGGFSAQFGWSNVVPNLKNYIGWFIDTQTAIGLVGIAALVVPLRRLWPGVHDRRVFWIIGLFVAVLWAEYCAYLVFEDWQFLRFLLPFWPFVMLGVASAAVLAVRSGPLLVAILVAWLVAALGVHGLHVASERGAFDLWRGDRGYVAAARAVRSHADENSVVFTLLHSGSVRYYGGRMTMRFDLLDRDWLDRTVAWLSERGVRAYALLDESAVGGFDSEIEYFRTRFAGQRTVDRLETSRVFTYAGPPTIALYDLSGSAAVRNVEEVKIDPADERCARPAPPPTLVWR